MLPDEELLTFFVLGYTHKNAHKVRGANLAVMRSTDKGATWSAPIIFDKLPALATTDPHTGQTVRVGRFVPDIAVDPIT